MTTLFMSMVFIAQTRFKSSWPIPVLQVYITENHRSQHSTTGTKTRDYVVCETAHWNLLHYDALGCLVTTPVSMKRLFEVGMVCLQRP